MTHVVHPRESRQLSAFCGDVMVMVFVTGALTSMAPMAPVTLVAISVTV